MARYFGELVPGDSWVLDLQTHLRQNNLTGKSPVTQESNMPTDQFIIGTLNEGGQFSVSSTPKKHDTLAEAEGEAKRLAAAYPSKQFVILQVRRVVKAVAFEVRDRI